MSRAGCLILTAAIWLPILAADEKEPARAVTLIIEQARGSDWRLVDPQTVFKPGDEIRFRFRANFAGYLYVLNQSSKGEYEWLFPTRAAGLDDSVQAGVEYFVPATDGSFVISSNPGYDTVFWIVSPIRLSNLPDLPHNRALDSAPRTPLLPRCKESTLRARGLCVDSNAGPDRLQDSTRLPPGLVPDSSLRARDLVIEGKTAGSRISAPAQLRAAFIYQFRVAHQ